MEESAAALYRRFARETRPDSPYARLWQQMAREEDDHAAAVHEAQWDLTSSCGWRVRLEGWTEAIETVAELLRRAEQLPPTASDDERMTAALDIELSEMDALRHAAIGAVCRRPQAEADHLTRLADTAIAHSGDPHVLALATIARARRALSATH